MCYWENLVENIEEKKNAFTKKMDKVGELADRKRVMVFADDDNAIDTKTHFEYITSKIDLSAEGFIKAVEDAIAMKLGTTDDKPKKSTKKKAPKVEEPVEEIEEVVEDVVEETPFDLEEGIEGDIFGDELEEEAIAPVDKAALTAIRGAYKEADAKAKAEVKEILGNYGGKLATEMRPSDVNKIIEILDI
jgi:hypothetical protein